MKIELIVHDERNYAIAEKKKNKEGKKVYKPLYYYSTLEAAATSYTSLLVKRKLIGKKLNTELILEAIKESTKETLKAIKKIGREATAYKCKKCGWAISKKGLCPACKAKKNNIQDILVRSLE